TLQKPEVRGRLDLAAIDFRLRDLGKEVQVQSGIVELSNDGAILHNVRVVIDDQGVLVIGASGVRAGRVEFTNLMPFKPGDFELVPNVNHVTFVATKSLPEGETPDLHLEATNLVVDANGGEHNVRMIIDGPMREARIDLTSDDGLDRNQAAMLLITGRTASDSQRVSTANPTVGANAATAADVGGQITRDAVDNLMQPYIDDTFYRLTGL